MVKLARKKNNQSVTHRRADHIICIKIFNMSSIDDSDAGEEIEQPRKRPRHSVEITPAYLFQNHLAIRKVLKYIYENADNEPEKFEKLKNKNLALKMLYEEITVHFNEGGGIIERLNELYISLEKWQGIKNKPIYLWNVKFLLCVYLKE